MEERFKISKHTQITRLAQIFLLQKYRPRWFKILMANVTYIEIPCTKGFFPSYIYSECTIFCIFEIDIENNLMRKLEIEKNLCAFLIQEFMNYKLHFGDRAFEKMAPKLWNNLPQNIRSITDFDKFKSMLKTHLFDNY